MQARALARHRPTHRRRYGAGPAKMESGGAGGDNILVPLAAISAVLAVAIFVLFVVKRTPPSNKSVPLTLVVDRASIERLFPEACDGSTLCLSQCGIDRSLPRMLLTSLESIRAPLLRPAQASRRADALVGFRHSAAAQGEAGKAKYTHSCLLAAGATTLGSDPLGRDAKPAPSVDIVIALVGRHARTGTVWWCEMARVVCVCVCVACFLLHGLHSQLRVLSGFVGEHVQGVGHAS